MSRRAAPRKKILIPDSAHGTNPATAAMVGYAVENLKSNAQGMVDVAALTSQMNEDVAAPHAHQSQHAGSVRAGDSQDRRHHARQGRACSTWTAPT